VTIAPDGRDVDLDVGGRDLAESGHHRLDRRAEAGDALLGVAVVEPEVLPHQGLQEVASGGVEGAAVE
jgi:hypothetical protein